MYEDDKSLLHQFRNEPQKEQAFTAILKKYQEKLYWSIQWAPDPALEPRQCRRLLECGVYAFRIKQQCKWVCGELLLLHWQSSKGLQVDVADCRGQLEAAAVGAKPNGL